MSNRLEPVHYFAYGSNMNPVRVAQRKLAILDSPLPGRLFNYELRFNKVSRLRPGAASANLAASFGNVVDGVLYRLASRDAIASMDVFERAPEDYTREVVFVHLASEQDFGPDSRVVIAWTYIARPSTISDAVRPTQEYIGHLLASPFLTQREKSRLQALKCLDD